MFAIEVSNVEKAYKNGVKALDRLNLCVKTGEIFSLLGQNGAGKSTLINILTTYLKLDSGSIKILGNDIKTGSEKIRYDIACVSQRTSIDTYLSLEENMLFQAKLYKISHDEAVKRMHKLINAFELNQYLKYPVSSYSGGIKRRLDIALNMISNPKILFLDEPTVGMDIQSRMAMWKIVGKIRDDFGTTIFLTTHYLEEADHLSNTICIMKNGKEVIQGTPFELREFIKKEAIKILFKDKNQAKENIPILKKQFSKEICTVQNRSVSVGTHNSNEDLLRINRFLLDQKIKFQGIEIIEPTLEDVFLRLTERR
ncbi:ATP-binding cassette domain-containing protein [Facklamia sp. P13055]|uniref:ABC transporter ATP-binding protein n=1 Tax=Facklamia sp. P13055 TaxID=3421952 RepID=UPI003D16A4CF